MNTSLQMTITCKTCLSLLYRFVVKLQIYLKPSKNGYEKWKDSSIRPKCHWRFFLSAEGITLKLVFLNFPLSDSFVQLLGPRAARFFFGFSYFVVPSLISSFSSSSMCNSSKLSCLEVTTFEDPVWCALKSVSLVVLLIRLFSLVLKVYHLYFLHNYCPTVIDDLYDNHWS